jgi:hypothetical protein
MSDLYTALTQLRIRHSAEMQDMIRRHEREYLAAASEYKRRTTESGEFPLIRNIQTRDLSYVEALPVVVPGEEPNLLTVLAEPLPGTSVTIPVDCTHPSLDEALACWRCNRPASGFVRFPTNVRVVINGENAVQGTISDLPRTALGGGYAPENAEEDLRLTRMDISPPRVFIGTVDKVL